MNCRVRIGEKNRSPRENNHNASEKHMTNSEKRKSSMIGQKQERLLASKWIAFL